MVVLYLWLWAGLILIFFNISTSQEYYLSLVSSTGAAPGNELRVG
jgi:hypothetical protein